MTKGFFMMPRAIFDDDYFDQKPFCRIGFMTYLCKIAIYKPQTREFNGVEVWLEKGDVAISLRELGLAIGWTAPKVKRFLKHLEKRNTIRLKTVTPVTIITLCFLGAEPGTKEADRYSDVTPNVTQPNKGSKKVNIKDLCRVGKKTPTSTTSLFREEAKEIMQFLITLTGRQFKMVETNFKPIRARLQEGATVQECKTMIARMHTEWENDAYMVKFLRPSTLFRPVHFENYSSLVRQKKNET